MAILTEIRDPRVRDVTVTYVEVSGDLRQAKVHVSVMGDEKKQNLCMKGLQSSAGFLQQKVAKRIDTRYTPRLVFEIDLGVKHSIEVSRMLRELLPKPSEGQEPEDEEVEAELPEDESLDVADDDSPETFEDPSAASEHRTPNTEH